MHVPSVVNYVHVEYHQLKNKSELHVSLTSFGKLTVCEIHDVLVLPYSHIHCATLTIISSNACLFHHKAAFIYLACVCTHFYTHNTFVYSIHDIHVHDYCIIYIV